MVSISECLEILYHEDKLIVYSRLFYLFIAKFTSFEFLQEINEGPSQSFDGSIHAYGEDDDLDQCLYYLRTFSNMLRWSSENVWMALANNTISTDQSHSALFKISKRSLNRNLDLKLI